MFATTYYRPKGQNGIPMPDLPIEHPGFLSAYAAASGEVHRLPERPGSISEAIKRHKASADFRNLAANTKAQRRPMLDDISRRYGAARIADLEDRHIQKDLDRLSGHASNNRLKAWQAFCKWAVGEYKLARNPA